MSDRLAWLEERRKGIGGSDIAAIAGLSPYASPWSVYWDKVNPVRDDNASEAAQWGTLMEDVVADQWVTRHGGRVARKPTKSVVDLHNPWMRGNPDRLLYLRPPLDGEFDDVLEVKLAGEWAWATQWDGGAEIPAWYQAQAQWYLMLTGAPRCHFAVLVGGNRMPDLDPLERNDRAIEQLVDIGRRFWFDHVLAGEPPPPDHLESTRRHLDELYPTPENPPVAVVPTADEAEDILSVIRDYRTARANAKAYMRAQDTAANMLRGYLGERGATDLMVGDTVHATYRPTRKLDIDELLDAAIDEGLDTEVIRDAAMRVGWDTKALEKVCGRRFVDRFRKLDPDRRTLRVPDPDEDQ